MSPRGFDPKDYEYDGSDADHQQMLADEAAASRQARFKATSVITTVVLAAAGLVGGAAFAMSQAVTNDPTQAPVVATTANPGAVSTIVPSATPVATTDDTASTVDNTAGKTIAVPPAAFDDKKGERDFHPAPSAGSVTAPPAGGSGPNFGGGHGDDGGEHHKHRTPAPSATGGPSFGNSDDGGSDD